MRRNRRRERRRRPLDVLRLEPRELLSVTSTVSGSLLNIQGDQDNDNIALTVSNGDVKINGVDPTSGPVAASDLSQIKVSTGKGRDFVDLRGVKRSEFTNGGTLKPVKVKVKTSLGNDTIFGSQFDDVLLGGGGTNDIIGGQGLDQRDTKQNLDSTSTRISTETTTLSSRDVELLLRRASAATPSSDAIITIVDRQGHILGVWVEQDVPITRSDKLTFAIDGALAKARTAAFFASNDAPLTSRTIRSLSESTITERQVNSNPNTTHPRIKGPGTVAPIGIGGNFPPGVNFTPQVDLFDIEHTNRDSIVHPGADLQKHAGDIIEAGDQNSFASKSDIVLTSRFNANAEFIPFGREIDAPESYGLVSGVLPRAQARGIATLPGGIPVSKNGEHVGGIGVFFPGPNGYASFEQNFRPNRVTNKRQSPQQRLNAPLVLESEFIAFSAAGGLRNTQEARLINAGLGLQGTGITNLAINQNGELRRAARIDLVGITLEIFGPNPDGVETLRRLGRKLTNGVNAMTSGKAKSIHPDGRLYASGEVAPDGWLVLPHSSSVPGELNNTEVRAVVTNGIREANRVRAAIRLPRGERTRMVFGVTDSDGEVLGIFRMPDATIFSIEVAVSKARNVAYYSSTDVVIADRLDSKTNKLIPNGRALSNRTFRFLAEPFYPEGLNGLAPPGPFSILNDPGTDRLGENIGRNRPVSQFQSVLGFHSFNPSSNFRDPSNIANQSGVVFFPGSTPVYRNGDLAGGFGVSGDGVDQDDVVTRSGAKSLLPPAGLRADRIKVRGVRLPFIKFLRNPLG